MTEGATPDPGEIAHGALRGAIAAMAMTGLRAFTISLGLVGEAPPRAIMRQKSKGLYRFVPRKKRRAAQEAFHCTYGAAGGATFAALPDSIKLKPWAGPVYGLLVWLGFELALAPVLNLSQARTGRGAERAALAADHLLYGFVLSETRRRPQG